MSNNQFDNDFCKEFDTIQHSDYSSPRSNTNPLFFSPLNAANNSISQVNQHQMDNIYYNSQYNGNHFNQIQYPTTSFYGNGNTSSCNMYPRQIQTNRGFPNPHHDTLHSVCDAYANNQHSTAYVPLYNANEVHLHSRHSTNVPNANISNIIMPSKSSLQNINSLSNINAVTNEASNVNMTTVSSTQNATSVKTASSTQNATSVKARSVKTTKSSKAKTKKTFDYTVESHSDIDFALKFLANFRDYGRDIDIKNNSMQLYYFLENIIKTICTVRPFLKYSHLDNQLKNDIKKQLSTIIEHYQDIGFLPNDSDKPSEIDVINHIYNFISSNMFPSNISSSSNVISNSSLSIYNSKSKSISPSVENIGDGPTDSAGLTDNPTSKTILRIPTTPFYHKFDSEMKLNHTVAMSTNRKRRISSINGTINIMETIIKYMKNNSSCNVQLLKGLEILRSVQIFKQFGFLLFEDIQTYNYNIAYGNEIVKIHDTMFSCLSQKLKIDVFEIEKSIIDYININQNNESFLSTICERNNDSNEKILKLERKSKLDFFMGEIRAHRISYITIPFLFNHFKFIFPDHTIILFKCEADKIVEVNYNENVNIHNFDFTETNAVIMIHYKDQYKLLYCMDPSYSINNDTDDEEN